MPRGFAKWRSCEYPGKLLVERSDAALEHEDRFEEGRDRLHGVQASRKLQTEKTIPRRPKVRVDEAIELERQSLPSYLVRDDELRVDDPTDLAVCPVHDDLDGLVLRPRPLRVASIIAVRSELLKSHRNDFDCVTVARRAARAHLAQRVLVSDDNA